MPNKKVLLPALGALALLTLFYTSNRPSPQTSDTAPSKVSATKHPAEPHAHPHGSPAAHVPFERTPPSATTDLRSWLANYQNAPAAAQPGMLADGLARAKARHARLRNLIIHQPNAALDEVLTLAEYQALPQSLLPHVERPASGYGDIDLQWATTVADDGSLHCLHQNRLYLGGANYQLYGPGRRTEQPPSLDVPVTAYLLDDIALVPESPILPVSGNDIAAAKALFGTADQGGVDPLTHEAVNPEIAALIGGTVYQFSNQDALESVAAELEATEIATAETKTYTVTSPYAWLAGDTGGDTQGLTERSFFADDNISVLFIRCDFSDFTGEPVTQTDLENDLYAAGATTVNGYLNEMSYGAASITATVTSTLYRATNTGTSYALSGDNDGLYNDIVAAYDTSPDALASSEYDVVAIYFPNLDGVGSSKINYAGLASVGGSRHWINGVSTSSGRLRVITHEFGHNYGLYHSNYWLPEQSLPGQYSGSPDFSSLEYGDIFDRMGSGSLPEAHFNHYQKNKLNWLPDVKVKDVTTDGTYRIYRFDHISALDNPTHALRVPMQNDVTYWVGFRQLYTDNTNMMSGAYVVAEGLYANRPNLIDMTPESAASEHDDRADAALPVGLSYVDADAGVTFTTIAVGSDGVGDEWLEVKVEFEPRFGIIQNTYEFDEARGLATLTVQRTLSDIGAASVDYSTSDSTATAGTDYTATSGTVQWADGENTDKQIVIGIKPDTEVEGIEDFIVALSNPTSGILANRQATATVSILDPGQRYSSFTPDFFNSSVRTIAFQSDGKAIIGGTIDSNFGGEFAGAGNIARLNAKGDVDPSFNTGGSGFDDEVNDILILSDNSMIIGGNFTSYNGTTVNRLVHLSANGTLDTTFNANIGTGANNAVHTIAAQSDTQILVGGDFKTFNGQATEGLIRINTEGTFGTALALPFSGLNVRDVLVQSDGKIMVTGAFSIAWTGSGWRSGMVRLNSNGTRDTSFDPDAGLHDDSSVGSLRNGYTITQLPDGDYLVGGWFTAYDENTSNYFARINNDGSFDRAFGSTLNDSVQDILVEPFGAAIAGGSFTTPASRLIRINEDWSNDTRFVTDGGPDVPDTSGGNAHTLAHAPDGSLWIGGNFFAYNGSSSRPIVRVASGVSPYDFWAAEAFTPAQIAAGDANPDADTDGDDIINLAEMALGTNPTVADATSIFGSGNLSGLELVEDLENQYLQMTLDKSAQSGGVWYSAQVSSDLTNWSPTPALPGDDTAYTILEDSGERLIIRDKTPISPGSPRFIRLVITTP